MLTGKRAFVGEDISDTLATVLKSDPEWNALPVDTPVSLRQVLRACLRKDPKQRIGDMQDVRLAMEGAFETAVEVPASVEPRRKLVSGLIWALAGSVAGMAIITVGPWNRARPDVPKVTRHSVSATPVGGWPDVVSPDGRMIAFSTVLRGELLVRGLDQLEWAPLRGAEGTDPVAFSPDGQSLLVSDGNSYLKVPLDGGPATRVTDDLGGGADWGPDDTIVVAGGRGSGLWVVSAVGGELRPIIEPRDDGTLYMMPRFLPDGRAVVYHILTGPELRDSQVVLYDFETDRERVLIEGTSPHYATSGHLVFSQGGGGDISLWAAPFDARRREVTGEARPVLGGIPAGGNGRAPYTLARDGTLVYRSRESAENRTLVWVDRQGQEEPVGMASGFYEGVRLSPDGQQLAVEDVASRDVLIHDLERDTTTRFIADEHWDMFPVWTVDGSRLVFASTRHGEGGCLNLHLKNADGTGTVERLTTSPDVQAPTSFTPDGEAIVLVALRPNTSGDVGMLALEDGAEVQWVFDGAFIEGFAEVSPDGRWIAYQSQESGRDEIYVHSFPDTDSVRRQISTDGGRTPVWAPDGRELFYRGARGAMMSVTVETEPTFRAGSPTLLFEAGEFLVHGQPGGRGFDIDPITGDRFLMVKADSEVVVVQNWTEELTRLVPVD